MEIRKTINEACDEAFVSNKKFDAKFGHGASLRLKQNKSLLPRDLKTRGAWQAKGKKQFDDEMKEIEYIAGISRQNKDLLDRSIDSLEEAAMYLNEFDYSKDDYYRVAPPDDDEYIEKEDVEDEIEVDLDGVKAVVDSEGNIDFESYDFAKDNGRDVWKSNVSFVNEMGQDEHITLGSYRDVAEKILDLLDEYLPEEKGEYRLSGTAVLKYLITEILTNETEDVFYTDLIEVKYLKDKSYLYSFPYELKDMYRTESLEESYTIGQRPFELLYKKMQEDFEKNGWQQLTYGVMDGFPTTVVIKPIGNGEIKSEADCSKFAVFSKIKGNFELQKELSAKTLREVAQRLSNYDQHTSEQKIDIKFRLAGTKYTGLRGENLSDNVEKLQVGDMVKLERVANNLRNYNADPNVDYNTAVMVKSMDGKELGWVPAEYSDLLSKKLVSGGKGESRQPQDAYVTDVWPAGIRKTTGKWGPAGAWIRVIW